MTKLTTDRVNICLLQLTSEIKKCLRSKFFGVKRKFDIVRKLPWFQKRQHNQFCKEGYISGFPEGFLPTPIYQQQHPHPRLSYDGDDDRDRNRDHDRGGDDRNRDRDHSNQVREYDRGYGNSRSNGESEGQKLTNWQQFRYDYGQRAKRGDDGGHGYSYDDGDDRDLNYFIKRSDNN